MSEFRAEERGGDRLFVYTAGVPEAIDPEMDAYGSDRMLRVLNTVKNTPQEGVLSAVRRDLRAFRGAADQSDDIMMLGFFTFLGSDSAAEDVVFDF